MNQKHRYACAIFAGYKGLFDLKCPGSEINRRLEDNLYGSLLEIVAIYGGGIGKRLESIEQLIIVSLPVELPVGLLLSGVGDMEGVI